MAFIEEAIRYGYQAQDILNMIGVNNPEFKKKLNDAEQYGYNAETILRSIAQSFQGARGEKTAKVMGINPKWTRNLAFSEDLDPATVIPEQLQAQDQGRGTRDIVGNIAGAAGGAALGYARGGPVGAITGAVAGSEMYQNLVNKHRQAQKRGKSISFSDFVKALATAAAKGKAVGFTAQFLMDVLKNLGKEGGEQATPPSEGEVIPVEGELIESTQAPGEQIQAQRQIGPVIPSDAIQRPGEIIEEEAVTQQVPSIPETEQSFVERVMQGVDYESLTKPKKNRISMLNRQLEVLEKRGERFEGKKVQKVVKKHEDILSGEGLSLLEGEQDRYETQYGDREAKLAKGIEKFAEKEPLPEEKEKRPPIEPEIKEEEEVSAKRPLEKVLSSSIQDVFKKAPTRGTENRRQQRNIQPIQNALKSSNVRGATYNEETGKMRAVFAPKQGRKSGTVYEYDNIDKETFEKMTGGKAKPVTEGSNEFGIWFREKEPSIGAAFSAYIRKNPEKFPYDKKDPKAYTVNERQIIESDRTHLASDFFEPFEAMRTEGRQKLTGKELRSQMESLKEMDDDLMSLLIKTIENKLNLKRPPTISRLKKEVGKMQESGALEQLKKFKRGPP